jgi:LysM repeat protein
MPNSRGHPPSSGTGWRGGRRLALAALPFLVAACGAAAGPAASSTTFVPPAPLSVVAVLGPSAGQLAAECGLLAGVVRAGATPSETLVVSPPASGPVAATYVVRAGDSLNALAAAQGVSLAALEAANPQLGPVAGRSWNRIYPGDRVTVPGPQGAAAADLVVTRAPSGPARPALVGLPRPPAGATAFQDAQYRHAVAAAQAANRGRVAAWWAEANRRVAAWQAKVEDRLAAIASSPGGQGLPAGGSQDLLASIRTAATTLQGLPGRRVLVLLGGQAGPPPPPRRGSCPASGWWSPTCPTPPGRPHGRAGEPQAGPR